VYVSNQLAQIAIRLAENRFIAPLKQVPNPLVLAIVVLTVASQETLHDFAYLIFLPFDEQVRVVEHQTVCVEIERSLCFLLSEHVCELEIVVVRTKDFSPIIAAAKDVIEASGDLDPWFSSHSGESVFLTLDKCQ